MFVSKFFVYFLASMKGNQWASLLNVILNPWTYMYLRQSCYPSKKISIHCSYYSYNVLPLPPGNFFKLAPECFDLAPIVLDIYFPCCLYQKLLQLILYIFCLRPGVSFFSRRNQHFLLVPFSGNAFKDYNLSTRVIPWYRPGFHFWAFSGEIMYFFKDKIYFEFILILPMKIQDFRIFI